MKKIIILFAATALLILSSCASSHNCEAYGSVDNNTTEELPS